MNNLNEVCGESLFMLRILCGDYILWTHNKYCKHSWFVNGNGYPGNFCCEATEIPRNITLYAPSVTPYFLLVISQSPSHTISLLYLIHILQVNTHPLIQVIFQATYLHFYPLHYHLGRLMWVQAILLHIHYR